MRVLSSALAALLICQQLFASEAWTSTSITARRLRSLSLAASASTSDETEALANSADDNDDALTDEELAAHEAFLQECRRLCDQRNLPLEKVKNARDLASVKDSPVQPGRIFRMGRVSDASEADICLLMDQLNITTLVDTRSPTELKDDPTLLRAAVFANFTTLVYREDGRRGKPGRVKELAFDQAPFRKRRFWKAKKEGDNATLAPYDPLLSGVDDLDPEYTTLLDDDDDDDDETQDALTASCPGRKERHFVSLMNEFKYVKGTVSKVRKRDLTKAVLKSPGALVSRRVRTAVKDTFVDKINDGGLPMLNELLLRFGAPGIRYVLELCADTSRHPVAFYCTAGKDRTGMIAAIILGLCGAEPEDIVEDYSLSANVYAEMNDHQAMVGALSQRNLDPRTFLSAPPQVMRDTLVAINETYGSVGDYCTWIGFGPEKQEKLREACMKP